MKRLQFWITIGLIGAGMPALAWAQQDREFYSPHMWHSGPWMFLGPLMMIIFITVVVVPVVLAVQWLGSSGHGAAQHTPPLAKTPLDILKKRFARGEIDKEEFEERRRVLGE